VRWRVLFGDPDLQGVGAALLDGLQGAETAIDDGAWDAYLQACAAVAGALSDDHDLLVLHDPAALGLVAGSPGRAVWHCHVDASQPDRPAIERAAPLAGRCARLAFPDDSFAPEALHGSRLQAAPPGIDPLSPRNLEPAARLSGRIVRPFGVDLARPFCCQVMRLDRWKDPHATVESFAIAKEELPDLQLVLAVALEGAAGAEWHAAKEISDYAGEHPDVHLLTSYEGVGNLELGALQRLARVALQRSLREGFGLGASEALWKGTPVVGGRQGGLPLQVRDGVDGYLTDDTAEAAGRLVELVRDPGLAVEMGQAGRERVRERFLVTRALEDELRLLAAALSDPPGGARAAPSEGATVDAP
jgi:trehalose synthase